MKANLNLFGHQIQINPRVQQQYSDPTYQSKVTRDTIRKGAEILAKYKRGKANLEARIVEEEQWYKLQHWDYMRKKTAAEDDPEPVTSYLFSTIANKHADAMDNFPEPNFLPREEDDEGEAKNLTKVIPKVLDENRFRKTYDSAWWYKIKHGFVIYGSFWNKGSANGLGDIDIVRLNALNVFWQPGIEDTEKSRNIFIVDLVDDDILYEDYPHLNGNIKNSKIIDVTQYIHDDTVDITGKSVVVDWYYKQKNSQGKIVVHLTKFVGEDKLYSTEDDPELSETGLYDHGMYPIDIDVLFPEEGTPVGFGYIAVVKSPQIYIDKLDQIISRNALMAGKKRFFVKDNCGINEQEFLDWSKDIIHCSGSPSEENLREFTTTPLDGFIVQHREIKKDELKEISGANDFNRGEGGRGVTAASAIAALQEAGNKLSRDMIQASYFTYSSVLYKCIELVRQFYDEERNFRIDKPDGKYEYIKYSNAGLKEQQLPSLYEGEEPKYRKPVFDIQVKPQRANPFSTMAHNEMAKEMYGSGFFDPARADQALIALEMMSFEGKEKIVQMVSENKMLFDQLQQHVQQMAQMKETMDKMAMIIQKISGKDILGQSMAPAGVQMGGVA